MPEPSAKAKPAPVKPGARRRMRREDRRSFIIDRSIEVFGRLGYHNATTSELAKAAEVSEALLYQHFPSKQALLIACLETLGEEIHGGLQRILEGGKDDPTVTFRALYEQLTTFLSERPEISRFSLVLLAELEDEEIRDAARNVVDRNVKLLIRALRRGQQRGALRDDVDPDLIGWLLVGLYQLFGLLQRLNLLDRIDPAELQGLVRTFLPTDHGRTS